MLERKWIIVLLIILIISSLGIALPVVRSAQYRARNFIALAVDKFEQQYDLTISYTGSYSNFFRKTVLSDLTLSSGDGSAEIGSIETLTLSYDLLALVFTAAEEYQLGIEIAGAHLYLDSRIGDLFAGFSEKSGEQNFAPTGWFSEKISEVLNHLHYTVTLTEGTAVMHYPEGVSSKAEGINLNLSFGNLPLRGNFSLASLLVMLSSTEVNAAGKLACAGTKGSFSLEDQYLDFRMFSEQGSIEAERAENLEGTVSLESIEAEGGMSLDTKFLNKGELVGTGVKADLRFLDYSLKFDDRQIHLSLSQISSETLSFLVEGTASHIEASGLPAAGSGTFDIQKPQISFKLHTGSSVDLSSFVWNSGDLYGRAALQVSDESLTAEFSLPTSHGELFTLPSGSRKNLLLQSGTLRLSGAIDDRYTGNLGFTDPSLLLVFSSEMDLGELTFHADSGTQILVSEENSLTLRNEAKQPALYLQKKGGQFTGKISTDLDTLVKTENIPDLQLMGNLETVMQLSFPNGRYSASLILDSFTFEGETFQDRMKISAAGKNDFSVVSMTIDLEELLGEILLETKTGRSQVGLSADNFSPDKYLSLLDRWLSIDTELFSGIFIDGEVTFEVPSFEELKGSTYEGDIDILNIQVPQLDQPLSLSSLFSGNAERAQFTRLKAETNGIILSAKGSLTLEGFLPDLQISFQADSMPLPSFFRGKALPRLKVTGESLTSGRAEVLLSDQYPVRDLQFSYNFLKDDTLQLAGSAFAEDIPLDFFLSGDLNSRKISGTISDQGTGTFGFNLSALQADNGKSEFSGTFTLTNYEVLEEQFRQLAGIEVTTSGRFTYNGADSWEVFLDSLKTGSIDLFGNVFSFEFLDMSVTPEFITAPRVVVEDGVGVLQGSAEFEIASFTAENTSLTAALNLARETERFAITIAIKPESYDIEAVITDADLRHLPFELGTGRGEGKITFSGTSFSDYNLVADLQIRNGIISGKSYSGRGILSADENSIHLEEFTGKYDSSTLTGLEILYSLETGEIEAASSQQFRTKQGNFSFDLDLATRIDAIDSINKFSLSSILEKEVIIDGRVKNIISNGVMLLEDFPILIDVQEDKISVQDKGERGITFEILDSGTIFGSIGQTEESTLPFSLSFEGTFEQGLVDFVSSDVRFNITAINSSFKFVDMFRFTEGEVYGTLRITGSVADPDFYGELFCDYASAASDTLTEEVTAENISGTMSEKTLYLAPFYVQSGKTFAKAAISIDFENFFPNYLSMALDIPAAKPIEFDHNFKSFGILFKGLVSGHIVMSGPRYALTVSGDILMNDALISMSPEGRDLTIVTDISADLNLVSGKNVMAIFPNPEVPIITATLSEQQKLSVDFNAPARTYQINGELEVLGGEIFYFQRSFFITSGVIKLKENHLSRFNPLITLDAKLRDFDRQGEKVDIILKLQNDYLLNMSPALSARPAKTINEIAKILGQNILPSSYVGGTDFGSALALATLATDVIQQLGIIELDPISDFEQVIRNNFQLDLFSIRTQFFQNIILDTISIPQMQLLSINPLARYLDNTSVFLGKYINNDLFLQAMLHLSANEQYGAGLFMTDDLKLDVELSLEWDNPLYDLKLSTQPEGMQPYQLLDAMTIGLSWNFSF